MNRIKRGILAIAVSSLYIIAFNVVVFVLSDRYDANFWCGYIFITLSWICLIGVEMLTICKKDIGTSLFLNATGILMTVVHLVVQTIFGITVMAIPSFSVKLATCFEIVIFSIYLGIIGLLEIYKSKCLK